MQDYRDQETNARLKEKRPTLPRIEEELVSPMEPE
jgi:hypothetical protein